VREDLPPTLKEAAQHAGLSRVATIREKFHDLHHNLIARISERRRKQLEQIRSSLDAAVTQEPAVSPSYLAQQVGKCPGHLYALFPDLWRTISLRWCDFKSGEFNRKREHLRQEVRRIVVDLYSAGVYPSRERVQALIAESPLRSTYIVRRELVRVKRELEERELLQANRRSPMQIG
jgi:hypothetical protein